MARLSPDATKRVNNPEFFRECLLTLKYRRGLSNEELGKILGVDTERISCYLRRKVRGHKKAMSYKYPEQFLVELLLEEGDRQRLLKQHVWRAPNGTRLESGNAHRQSR